MWGQGVHRKLLGLLPHFAVNLNLLKNKTKNEDFKQRRVKGHNICNMFPNGSVMRLLIRRACRIRANVKCSG